MKKIILAFGVILLTAGCHNNEQQQVAKMTPKLVNRINSACQLTPDQEAKITPIAENFIKLRKDTKVKYQNDEEGFRNAMQANRQKFLDTLKTILTPDQFEKLVTAFQQKARQNQQSENGQD